VVFTYAGFGLAISFTRQMPAHGQIPIPAEITGINLLIKMQGVQPEANTQSAPPVKLYRESIFPFNFRPADAFPSEQRQQAVKQKL
jgi:hypothetical protein